MVSGIYEDCGIRLKKIRETGRDVLRLIIPDKHNRFPEDENYMEPYRHQELEMFENQEIHDLNFQQCPEKSPKSKTHQLNHPERQKIYFQAIPLLFFLKYRLQISFPPSTMWNQHIKHVDYGMKSTPSFVRMYFFGDGIFSSSICAIIRCPIVSSKTPVSSTPKHVVRFAWLSYTEKMVIPRFLIPI